jgi:hypothetical protein
MTVRFWLGPAVATGLLASLALPAGSGLAAPEGQPPVTLTTATGDADILSAPSTSPGVTIKHIVVAANSPVQVACYLTGEAIHHDSTWYRVVAPVPGYIAGAQLNVSREPADGVPRCAPAAHATTAGTPGYGHRRHGQSSSRVHPTAARV